MYNQIGEIKLKYGLRDDKIVYIDDLTQDERGLSCKCVCPSCNMRLVAKLGNKNQHHFAHAADSNCSIEYAQQTALHLMAKEIIEEEKKIRFPAYYIYPKDLGLPNYYYLKPFLCTEEREVHFDEVRLENRICDIIPDIILRKAEHECLIEIAVTHFVDEEKQKKIREIGLPMLEIDLSDYRGILDKQALADILQNKIDNKKWISNPRFFEEKKDVLRKEFEEIIKDVQHLQEKKRQEQFKIRNREPLETRQIISKALQPENYKNIIRSLRDDKKVFLIYQETKMYRNEVNKSIPHYLDIPIKGEIVFNCDRRIWQMCFFEKFIYFKSKIFIRNKSIKNYFVSYFKDEYGYDVINRDYYNYIAGDDLLWIAIHEYLKKLSNLGFVDYESFRYDGIVKATHTILPPDHQYAELLKQAMNEIDCFEIDASEKIDQYISQRLKE